MKKFLFVLLIVSFISSSVPSFADVADHLTDNTRWAVKSHPEIVPLLESLDALIPEEFKNEYYEISADGIIVDDHNFLVTILGREEWSDSKEFVKFYCETMAAWLKSDPNVKKGNFSFSLRAINPQTEDIDDSKFARFKEDSKTKIRDFTEISADKDYGKDSESEYYILNPKGYFDILSVSEHIAREFDIARMERFKDHSKSISDKAMVNVKKNIERGAVTDYPEKYFDLEKLIGKVVEFEGTIYKQDDNYFYVSWDESNQLTLACVSYAGHYKFNIGENVIVTGKLIGEYGYFVIETYSAEKK